MKSTVLKSLFIFLFLNVSDDANSQTRFGFVDVDSAITFLSEFKQDNDSVKSIISVYSDTIRQMENEFQPLYDLYFSERSWSPVLLQKMEDSLLSMQLNLEAYKLVAEKILLQFRNESIARLHIIIEKKMELFCKETGLIGLFDEKTSFYCSDCLDCNLAFKNYLLAN